jgi:hypothetical protein
MNKIKCQICGKEFKKIEYHLSVKHNMNSKEYFDKYIDEQGKCGTCGKPTTFLGLKYGYRKYCSSKCAASNFETKQKREQTNLKKYGVKNISENEAIKQKKKETVFQNYGTTHPLKNIEYREQQKAKNRENFGQDWYTQTKDFKQSYKKTCLEKYGVENFAQSDEYLIKSNRSRKSKTNKMIQQGYIPKEEICAEYGTGWLQANIIVPTIYYNKSYIHESNIQKIIDYVKIHKYTSISNKEKQIVDYIRSIYNGEIIENTRKIISPQELDIYIPEKNLAIEFNGNFWHSTQNIENKYYHFNKSIVCEEKGIRLIHIYEYELEENIWPKIKLMLNEALGITHKIYARQCEIREISNKDAKELNNAVHLQGHRNAKITYGLFYENKLVQLMSFSNTRYNKNLKNENEWEIIRGCPGSNTSVIGGISKLLKHFIRDYKPSKIFSYCDFNKFNGKSYEAVGMKFIGYTSPDKTWIVNGEAIKRNPNRYQELKGNPVIWGSGSKKYVLELEVNNNGE